MSFRFLTAVLAALLLAGCATFTEQEIATIQQRGVSPRIVEKMDRGRELTPGEIMELTRRRVPESLILRQIDDVGVNYVITKEHVRTLRKAGVSPAVIDALVHESERFAYRYAAPYGPYDGYYDDWLYGPSTYPWYGDWSVGIGFSGHHHHHRHCR